jgi:hypothetical protein
VHQVGCKISILYHDARSKIHQKKWLNKTAVSVGLNLPASIGYEHQVKMLVYHSSCSWLNCAEQKELSASSQRFQKEDVLEYWRLRL